MKRKELELFMIEYALTALQGELRSFSRFYQTDQFSVEYEMEKDHGTAYLITPDDRTVLAEVYFEDVAYVLNHPFEITEKPFMALCSKYKLSVPADEGVVAVNE